MNDIKESLNNCLQKEDKNDYILFKKSKLQESSTIAIEQIREAVLKLAFVEGRGIKMEINAINNKERKNCSIKFTVEID